MSGNESNFSLFSGMNLGGSEGGNDDVQSYVSQEKTKTTLLDVKTHNIESPKYEGSSSCETKVQHSSFSFIRATELCSNVETTSADDGIKKSPKEISSEEEKVHMSQHKEEVQQVDGDTISLLDLFETLDINQSIVNQHTILSYTDQLAEILPMTSVDDDTPVMSLVPSDHGGSEIIKEGVLINRNIEENINDGHAQDIDADFVTEDEDNSKYNLVLKLEDNMALFLSQHSVKLTHLRDEKAELRRNLCLVYEDIKTKVVSLEEKLASLKLKFDDVLCNDDYDLAADINEQIEELTIERRELQSETPSFLQEKVSEYLTNAALFKENEMKFHEWALSKYNELETQQRDQLMQYRLESNEEIEKKKEKLQNQQGEINRCLEHLNLDKRHVNKDRTELDKKIDTKLEVFEQKKNVLVEKRDILTQEIELLENKLRDLKNEKRHLEDGITSEENKMKEARKEFESLEKRLKVKSEEIEHKENTLRDQLDEIAIEENDLEEICSENRNQEETFLKNISYLTENRKKSEGSVEKCRKPIDSEILEMFLRNGFQGKDGGLKKLKALEKEKTVELQEMELKVFNKEQQIMTKKKRLDEIGEQNPEFEKAKKLAVTEHNFKEAKRLNEIIKQLRSEDESCKEEILVLENALNDKREQIRLLKDEVGTVKKDLLSATENHDNKVFVQTVDKITELAKEKERISEDSLLETLRRSELDLLKTEFSFLDIPSERFMAKMSDIDQENVSFVKEFVKQESDIVDDMSDGGHCLK